MDVYFSFSALVSALIFMALGVLVFSILLKPFAMVYLKAFRREIIEEKNVAAAVLIGFVSLSLSVIIAAAVH